MLKEFKNYLKMKVDYIKTRLNAGNVHVAFDLDTLQPIRVTEAASGKEIELTDYDKGILYEEIVDYVSDGDIYDRD